LHSVEKKWPNGNPLLQLRQDCRQETLLLFGFATCALAALAPRPTRLTGQGYNAKVLAELLNAKSREINSFLSGQLGRAEPTNYMVNCWQRESRFSYSH
jgi:hypothetical protein